jgi:hypothetical protein
MLLPLSWSIGEIKDANSSGQPKIARRLVWANAVAHTSLPQEDVYIASGKPGESSASGEEGSRRQLLGGRWGR